MQVKFSLTPSRVASLKEEIDENTTAERREQIESLPDEGFEFVGEKEQFDLPFEEFIEWLTGAEVTVDDGDPSYAQHLMIEHAKFGLSEAGRRWLASNADFTAAGNLTAASQKALEEFINEYKPSPGRSSNLEKKSVEELEEMEQKMQAKLAQLARLKAQKASA